MKISSNIMKNVYTVLFIGFLMIVAVRIPVSAFLSHPAFYNDGTKYFYFNSSNFSLYKSDGFAISNVDGVSVIAPFQQIVEQSLYDLYLGFDNNDFTNNYTTIKRSYNINTLQRYKGKHSAKFVSRDNSIVFFPNNNSIFKNNSSGLQNFTVSFSLYPYLVGEGTQTVAKYESFYTDPVDGNKNYGFRIVIKSGIIHYHFDNFFMDEQGNFYSFTLREQMPLIDKKWEQHTLVVDSASGVIKSYRGVVEEDVVLIRKNQNNMSAKLRISSLLNTESDIPLAIGQNSFFSLDEFIIYRDAVSDFMNYTPYQNKFLETEVYNISQNISQLQEVNLNTSDTNQYFKLAYRISSEYFIPSTSITNIPWVYIDPAKKKFPLSYSQGKYIQWRVEYVSPPEVTDEDFFIRDLFVKYKETVSPGIVLVDQVIAKDQSIEISWKTLPNNLIDSYEIYYGNKPNHYFGKSTVSPVSPISVDVSKSSVSESIKYHLEGLDNNKLYYISIRAKDIYGQYGPFSPEMVSRPSSVNTEFGYSINR